MFLNWSFWTHKKEIPKRDLLLFVFSEGNIKWYIENWDFWTRLIGDSEYFN